MLLPVMCCLLRTVPWTVRFGFNNKKTMVDGLDGEKTPTWEGGDFATIVHQLRLLGFNAVRLPFLFGDLYTLPPQVREQQPHTALPCGIWHSPPSGPDEHAPNVQLQQKYDLQAKSTAYTRRQCAGHAQGQESWGAGAGAGELCMPVMG